MQRKTLIILLVLFSQTVMAQYPFKGLGSVSETKIICLPVNIRYTVLFSEKDTVVNAHGIKAPAKGSHDYIAFIEDKTEKKIQLYIGHETNSKSDILGDGGGATLLNLEKKKSTWVSVGEKKNIDFSNVGGTYDNCGGAITSNNTILTAEEFPPINNTVLYKSGKGFRDTSDYDSLKRYQNMGWVVEVDLKTKTALRKLYKMGRYSHEGILIMPDNKTVYLTDDFLPSVFFKFVSKVENDFTDGQLFAYRQSDDGLSGNWIALPMDMKSLINSREVAIQLGASMFARAEWITLVNGLIYITETGSDDFSLESEILRGGKLAKHIELCKKTVGYDYPYGAVLVFDPNKNSMNVLLTGGQGKAKHFSNPDAITNLTKGNKNYLVISEDLIGVDKGRTELNNGNITNELWWLDLSIKNPTVDDLERFMVAPIGAETTGGFFTPDGKSFFINIQHPDKENDKPFHQSVTIVVEGFKKRID